MTDKPLILYGVPVRADGTIVWPDMKEFARWLEKFLPDMETPCTLFISRSLGMRTSYDFH